VHRSSTLGTNDQERQEARMEGRTDKDTLFFLFSVPGFSLTAGSKLETASPRGTDDGHCRRCQPWAAPTAAPSAAEKPGRATLVRPTDVRSMGCREGRHGQGGRRARDPGATQKSCTRHRGGWEGAGRGFSALPSAAVPYKHHLPPMPQH